MRELIEGRCEEQSGFVPFVATTMERAQDALHRWLSFFFFFTVKGGRWNTHSMFSGLPVSVQGLSNIPPLSGSRRRRKSYINSSYARPNENQDSDYSKVHL